MARLDADAGEIVLRVVYDGPPEAGKTTSLRALAGSLAQPAITPEEDPDGRTLWFDWMEYVGGRFEGCRLRCQIVSVPGQPELAARRRIAFDGADVVVCVADTTADGWPRSRAHVSRLLDELAAASPPRPGVVLQANKRDLPGALGLDALRDELAAARATVGLIESVASDGTGIREAFVYAIRLALDRVRALMTQRALPTGAPELASADDLLARMRGLDDRGGRPLVVEAGDDSLAASLLREVLACEDAASRGPDRPLVAPGDAPRPPDTRVPSGAIWPPVEGRAILHEVGQLELTARRLSTGDWAAGLGSGWRVVSSRTATHADLDEGRGALIEWARLHAVSLPVLSPRRCIVLAEAGDGSWRRWQIVHAEESLRDLLGAALREPTAEQLVHRLCQVAQLLLDADRKLARAPGGLTCSLDSVGVVDGLAVYIGLMPEADVEVAGDPDARASPPSLLRAQLGPLVQHDLAERRRDLHGALARVPRQFVHADTILSTLAGLLHTG